MISALVLNKLSKELKMKLNFSASRKKLHHFFSLFTSAFLFLLLLFVFNACQKTYEDIHVQYFDEAGKTLTAIYHNPISEGTYSVTLKMSEENIVTLNQAEAASGVKYTDQNTLIWWTKGEGAFMMKPDENGKWQIVGTFKEKTDSP